MAPNSYCFLTDQCLTEPIAPFTCDQLKPKILRMSLNQAANTVNRKNLDLAGQTVLTRTKDLMISLESMIRKRDQSEKGLYN